KTYENKLYALADSMKVEYRMIVDSGFILQIDDPRMVTEYDSMDPPPSPEEYRRFATVRIEALNHALAGLPEDRIRYHMCWGSWHGPHTTDIPLRDLVDIILQVRAGAWSLEAANARHAHEYHVWEDGKLHEAKMLVPCALTRSCQYRSSSVGMLAGSAVKLKPVLGVAARTVATTFACVSWAMNCSSGSKTSSLPVAGARLSSTWRLTVDGNPDLPIAAFGTEP